MTLEEQKATARRWIIGIWNTGNLELIDEMALADRYSYQSVPGDEAIRGQSFKDFVVAFRSAFPDLHNTIEWQVSEGAVVITHGVTRGTQHGPFAGIAPSGKTIEVPWVMVTSFEDGRIVADWEMYDHYGMMTQLGAIPAAAQAS